MRSHKKIFNRLATFGQKLRDNKDVLEENKNVFQEPRDPRRGEPDGPEKLSQNNKTPQNESHIQDHLDNRKIPHLSILGDPLTCKECDQSGEEYPRSTFPGERFDDCNSLSATPKTSNLSKSSKTSKEVKIQEIHHFCLQEKESRQEACPCISDQEYPKKLQVLQVILQESPQRLFQSEQVYCPRGKISPTRPRNLLRSRRNGAYPSQQKVWR